MESVTPPPYHRSDPKSRTKSASRLSRINQFSGEDSPNLSLELVVPSIPSPSNTLSPRPHKIHDLLLLSLSPHPKSKTRLAERLELADQHPTEPKGSGRRYKTRNSALASPKNNPRSRRRFEHEIREERDLGLLEEMGKPRKRRNSGRSKKEKLDSVTSIPSPKANEGAGCNLDRIGQLMTDLIMWNDVAKSSLWFGFGSLCFVSSCFASGVSFSAFSMISQLGLLVLVVAFFSNSVGQRDITERRDIKLNEDGILKAARVILPAANLAICKTGELFSGDPSTTLKVAPFLLLGAGYGHLINLWNLCALGFFLSFTCPKLYCSYSIQINGKVKFLRHRVLEAWKACSHKKIVAASAATAFWNMTSIKTRIFAAFISLVIIRYHRQYSKSKEEEKETEQEQQQQQALVLVESGSQK